MRLEIQQESSAAGAAVGALGAVPITKRQANTTVVVQDQQTIVIGGLMRDEYTTSREKIPVLGDLPLLGALFRHTNTVKRKANLLLILTPHVIRDQSDLRRIFERKMQERQEFLDRFFVFNGKDWQPPRDWSRTNGLVEEIRKTYRELAEQQRLEDESRGEELEERQPTEPIALPGELKSEAAAAAPGAAGAAARRLRRERARESEPAAPVPAPGGAAPAPSAPATPAAPNTPPPAPPPPAPEGKNDLPFRIQPQARSVDLALAE